MDVQQLIDTLEEPWYNQTLVQVGDVLVRLGVMQGEFHIELEIATPSS